LVVINAAEIYLSESPLPMRDPAKFYYDLLCCFFVVHPVPWRRGAALPAALPCRSCRDLVDLPSPGMAPEAIESRYNPGFIALMGNNENS